MCLLSTDNVLSRQIYLKYQSHVNIFVRDIALNLTVINWYECEYNVYVHGLLETNVPYVNDWQSWFEIHLNNAIDYTKLKYMVVLIECV